MNYVRNRDGNFITESSFKAAIISSFIVTPNNTSKCKLSLYKRAPLCVKHRSTILQTVGKFVNVHRDRQFTRVHAAENVCGATLIYAFKNSWTLTCKVWTLGKSAINTPTGCFSHCWVLHWCTGAGSADVDKPGGTGYITQTGSFSDAISSTQSWLAWKTALSLQIKPSVMTPTLLRTRLRLVYIHKHKSKWEKMNDNPFTECVLKKMCWKQAVNATAASFLRSLLPFNW